MLGISGALHNERGRNLNITFPEAIGGEPVRRYGPLVENDADLLMRTVPRAARCIALLLIRVPNISEPRL